MAKRKKKIDYKNTSFIKLLFLGMFGKDPRSSTISNILGYWGLFLWLSFFAIGIPAVIVHNSMEFFDWLLDDDSNSNAPLNKKLEREFSYRELENKTMTKLSQIYPNGVRLFCDGTWQDYRISLNFKSDVGDVRKGDFTRSRAKDVFGPEKKVSRTIQTGKDWKLDAEVYEEMQKGNWFASWIVDARGARGFETLVFDYQEDPNTGQTKSKSWYIFYQADYISTVRDAKLSCMYLK